MEFADGTPVAEFHPGEAMTETTIHNNTAPENPRILMYNPGTSPGEALDPGQAVLNTVTYVNLSNAAADMRLTIHLDSGTNVLDGGGGIQYNGGFQNKSQVQAGGVLVFDLKDIKPLQSGSVTFATEVGGTSSRISASLKYNGNTVITEKEVPVLQPGELTLYHEVTGSGKNLCGDETEEFEIRLFADNGEELRGSYPYWGNGGTGTVHLSLIHI